MLKTTIRVARAGEERTDSGRTGSSELPPMRGADRNAIRRELTRRTASTDTLHDENFGERQSDHRLQGPSHPITLSPEYLEPGRSGDDEEPYR
ncbi:hypothetical protein CEP52_003092 [Fusarium oligoseptatum]|uniref:Uncharacterized protein n=1 Tax=Fusarium oligoseptatum TaxID=2604345 RepID=A0A428UA53_9HYPO|nr:hypothetical protein CEP52_003092 [Fusarium oligoseptatum]